MTASSPGRQHLQRESDKEWHPEQALEFLFALRKRAHTKSIAETIFGTPHPGADATAQVLAPLNVSCLVWLLWAGSIKVHVIAVVSNHVNYSNCLAHALAVDVVG
jgi:hypothetical protein